jgi:hypothetical protein
MKPIIFAFCFFPAIITCAEDVQTLILQISVDGGLVMGSVQNTGDKAITVFEDDYGWWEWTTIFYHDGQGWHEARLKGNENQRARKGYMKSIMLQPGKMLLEDPPRTISGLKIAPRTFALSLSDYDFPRDKQIFKVRVVTHELWSNIVTLR